MATKLKVVPTVSPFALALIALDNLRGDIFELTAPDAENVDVRLAIVNDEPVAAVSIMLKPFVASARTVLKLESNMLRGYDVTRVQSSLENTSSSRRVVTAIITGENVLG